MSIFMKNRFHSYLTLQIVPFICKKSGLVFFLDCMSINSSCQFERKEDVECFSSCDEYVLLHKNFLGNSTIEKVVAPKMGHKKEDSVY